MNQMDKLKKLLSDSGLKVTTVRVNLLTAIFNFESAIPYGEIKKALPLVDRVTLYRNLSTLIKQGVIHEAYKEGSEVYYAMCGESCSSGNHLHQHIHFKCEECETVSCEELNTTIELSIPEYEISEIAIHAIGICKLCRKAS